MEKQQSMCIKLTYKVIYETEWVLGKEVLELFFKTQDRDKIIMMEMMRLRKTHDHMFDGVEPLLEVRIENVEKE